MLKTQPTINIWQVKKSFSISNDNMKIILKTSELLFLINQTNKDYDFITEKNERITLSTDPWTRKYIEKIF